MCNSAPALSMRMSVESLLYIFNSVKCYYVHSDQFWYHSLQLGHALGRHQLGDRNTMFPFLSLFPSVPSSVGICLCWGWFCYLKIYIVRTIWSLNSSLLHFGVQHWRNRSLFPYWWTDWLHCPHWQRHAYVFYCIHSFRDVQEKANSCQVYLAVIRTKPPIVCFSVNHLIQACR